MANFYLGRSAKAYYGDTTFDRSGGTDEDAISWTEIDNIRNVRASLGKAEADITTRGSNGYRLTAGALVEPEIEFELQYKDSDTAFDELKAAWEAGTEISMAFMTTDITTVGAEGLAANFHVVDFSRDEAIDGTIVHTVRVKPSSDPDWYEKAAS